MTDRALVGTGSYGIAQSPYWILRHHAPSSIHSLCVIQSSVGLLLAAGDSDGQFSLTSLLDYRPRYFWKAHQASILGVDVQRMGEENVMLSSGRDNHLHTSSLSAIHYLSSAVLPSRIQSDLPIPKQLQTLDINALNYCPFSSLQCGDDEGRGGLLVAVPHVVDSGYIDIFHLPSQRRIAAALGRPDMETPSVKAARAPIVMSLCMFKGSRKTEPVRIVAGYEDGFVRVWKVEGEKGSLEWAQRRHTESIMAIALSSDQTFLVSVAADRQVVRYEMDQEKEAKSVVSNSAGHASIAIRRDGQCIAIGGWDGCVRLYNGQLEQLASLRYHKDTVQALSFVQHRELAAAQLSENSDESEEEDDETRQGGQMDNVLVSGGKEGRICLWKT